MGNSRQFVFKKIFVFIHVYSCVFVFKKNIIVFLNFLNKRRLMFLRVLARGKGLSALGKGIKGRKERLFWM